MVEHTAAAAHAEHEQCTRLFNLRKYSRSSLTFKYFLPGNFASVAAKCWLFQVKCYNQLVVGFECATPSNIATASL